ncbi:MAG: S9 family peptidase, partial [bacterium]|nr:S9 family peptidase [bacterium]
VSKVLHFIPDGKGKWNKRQVKTPENATLYVFNADRKSDDYFIGYQNFLSPDTLYLVSGKEGKLTKLKGLRDQFKAAPFTVKQYEAVSKDGTKIPYFMVMRKDLLLNGKNPTLIYGYGGFQHAQRPVYSAVLGKCWYEKGGVYIVANIRGGGEFGPKWHQAALKQNRHKAFEDFIAVAEDVVKRKITSPEKLAIRGGSNGGLLVGSVFLMRPDLYKAVVCQQPLLDMKRYHKLLAGSSWTGEYGNPDKPEEWAFIKTYSPYQNIKKDAKYPKVFFTSSTRDDRVHPAHARKMAAKMEQMGHPVFYYENVEGGHAGAANSNQRAYMN